MSDTSTPFDAALPFVFYADREDAMYAAMREIKRDTGIRHFLLIAPAKSIRFTGFPDEALHETIGTLIGRVRETLAAEGFLISWWNTSTLKVGPGVPYTRITGLGGDIGPFSYCPLDPAFRRRFVRQCEIVARKARPCMILFEDDYEFSNHGAVRYGCFCELHLQRFAERTGRRYTREELVECFSSVNDASIRLRRLYADMMGETLSDLAAETAAAVQACVPETRLGLCQPGCWSLDGDMTAAVTLAFAGKNRPWVRICGASYGTDTPVAFPPMLYSVLHTVQHLPAHVEKYYESDTFPHSRFFCSATMLQAMITLALSYGCEASLLYATHNLPDPLIERGYLEMYRDKRRRFAALREALREHTVAGLGLVPRPAAAAASPWTNNGMSDGGLTGPTTASRLFSRYGFPFTTLAAKVQVLAGAATARILDDAEMRRLLSGALLIDGPAARVLSDRGYAELIGANVSDMPDLDFDAEIIRKVPGLEALAGEVLYSMAYFRWGTEYDTLVAADPLPGTEVVSDFVYKGQPVVTGNATQIRQHGLMRCVNRLGGRVVLTPTAFTTQSANSFGYQKRDLLRLLLGWLAPDAMPATVLDAPNVSLTANISADGASLVLTLFNLCIDHLPNLLLAIAPPFVGGAVEILDGDTWQAVKHGWDGTTLDLACAFDVLQGQVVRISQAPRSAS